MNIDLSTDGMTMFISSEYSREMDIMTERLTRDHPDGWLVRKMHGDHVNTERKFINDAGYAPLGLWLEVFNICRESNLNVQLTDSMSAYISSFNLDYRTFYEYIDNLFEGATNDKGDKFYPYGYQIDGAYNLLKYRKCCGEMCTSSGKTLMSYMMFKYMRDVLGIKKVIYIVPSVDLAKQSVKSFESYEAFLREDKQDMSYTAAFLYSNMTKRDRIRLEDADIIFGTYQSLAKKTFEYFAEFDAMLIDEAHHTAAKSIKDIIIKSANLKYCIGITGTFPKREHMDYLTIQSFVGPVVYRYSTNELINTEKKGTPIYINTRIIDWATDDEKLLFYMQRATKDPNDPNSGTKCLRAEQKFVNNSEKRLKYICDIAISAKKNTLVLFGDVKGGYGRDIYDYIKNNSDKTVYYCDGDTDTDEREAMKQKMEADLSGNTVMVASIGTMGEGIDMKNLWLILLVNTAKTDRLVRQIIGRGLRLFEGKNKTVMIDFVDDLRWAGEVKKANENYLWKHYKKRLEIYNEQKFPVMETYVDLRDHEDENIIKLL